MAIILFFICFVAIFFTLLVNNTSSGKREVLLHSVLTFSIIIAVLTETLGFFHIITFTSLLISWLIITGAFIFYLYTKKRELSYSFTFLKKRISHVYKQLSVFERILLIALSVMLILTFFQGIIYPPNNRDSLIYHMARIPSWIAHRSVDPFPTHIVRQFYQPPFAEYVILNFNLLNLNDYFSASVQFFFLLFSGVSITLIVRFFGLGRIYQVSAFILAITVPEVILQASSTQNDIVVAFFIVTTFYYVLKSIKDPSKKNYLILGLAAGLALFTKGTAYMYLAPILLIFGIDVLIKTFKEKTISYLVYGLIFVALVPVLISSRQYYRNYTVSHSILGIDENESHLYGNERMNPALFVCNVARNADLHMGIMFVPRITHVAGKVVHKIFDVTGVNINDTTITYPEVRGIPGDPVYYMGMLVATHEDYGGNLIHLVLIFCSIVVLTWTFFRKKNPKAVNFLLLTVVLQIIIFCAYLKWQPLGSRLQTSIFLLGLPLVCYALFFTNITRKVTFYLIVPFCIFYAYLLVLFNFGRPYITHYTPVRGFYVTAPTAIIFDRFKKQFSINYNYKSTKEYRDITNDILKSNYKNIGLILGYNDWEYPLFTTCYTHPLNPVHIFVKNYTKNIKTFSDDVDCIVSTTINKPYIDYKGQRFYNQDQKNTLIYYYKK